jgi:asparagine synthase (glutamine-hydrolysing)
MLGQRDTLRHRGPDDAGLWCSADARVAFGHRRLAIVDLSAAGHQPMTDSEGDLQITFNGEIYNFRELRRELESRGISFRSETDTEVILAAYRTWGIRCLERFVGMFAFGIFDLRANALFIARDRVGEKPLFYTHTDGRLSFASELKALLADPTTPRVMDPEAVDWYLTYGYVPGERCILGGVHKLRAAHALWYDLTTDSLRVWSYWQPPQALTAEPASADDLATELTQLLSDAVRMQLLADVPVGILLSGGVDSSLVTAMAARVSSAPVRTFTVTFPQNKLYDEAPFARKVAAYFGTRHEELVLEPASVDLLPMLARQYDEPIADSSMVPTYMISRLIREHATVALGGDGGDELFGGYPHYSWLLRQERPRRLIPRSVRALVSAGAGVLPVGTRGRNHLLGMADPNGGIAYVNLYFDQAARKSLVPFLRGMNSRVSTEQVRGSAYSSGGGVLRRATRADLEGFLVEDILVKVDRASMLCSLEVRAPFLDHRIVEFAFGKVPDHLRATTTSRKVLPGLLATRLLPSGFDAVRKRGFTLPLADWFKGDWGRFFEATLLNAPDNFLDRSVVADLIRKQKTGFANVDRLFSLAMLELWRREYDVAVPG